MNGILILCNQQLQEFFSLKDGVVKVGRESDNDIQLLDDSVSRHHAELSNMPHTCEVQDRNSSNGTFVNGKQIQTAVLRHGDEVRFGNTVMRFEEVANELHDDSGKSRDYSPLSQHSTVRVKRHPEDTRIPTPDVETKSFTPPAITINRKDESL